MPTLTPLMHQAKWFNTLLQMKLKLTEQLHCYIMSFLRNLPSFTVKVLLQSSLGSSPVVASEPVGIIGPSKAPNNSPSNRPVWIFPTASQQKSHCAKTLPKTMTYNPSTHVVFWKILQQTLFVNSEECHFNKLSHEIAMNIWITIQYDLASLQEAGPKEATTCVFLLLSCWSCKVNHC